MITPDLAQAKQQMQQQVNAATAVTGYCQAVITLLPAYSSLVKGADLGTLVTNATTHATTWSQGLCQSSTEIVPELFAGFSTAYTQAEARMLADEQALQRDPGDRPPRDDLVSRLSSLVSALKDRGAKVAALQQSLTVFQAALQGDHAASATVIARLSATSEGGVLVSQARGELGLNFVDAQQLSPCVSIISIDSQVAISLDGGPAAGTEVIPAVMIDALLSSLQNENVTATQALSALADTWQVVTGKYDSLTTDLKQAQSDQVGDILQQLDLQQAASAWRQLAEFAESIRSDAIPAEYATTVE